MFATEALTKFIQEVVAPVDGAVFHTRAQVLDIGAGAGDHAFVMSQSGIGVECCELHAGCDYMTRDIQRAAYEGIWCSHVLEHMLNIQGFLYKTFQELKPNGVLSVTVPPSKHEIVGGHVSLWNAGLLLYRLVLAGYDCSAARVGTYGYNVSVIVRKKSFIMPDLYFDRGDVTLLAPFFPCPVKDGFNGQLKNINW